MRHYFTADLHLDHDNIRKYCNRPFDSVKEMNATLIANWNSLISGEDSVYILGDFCFGTPERTLELIRALNGNKTFIRGNHDRNLKEALQLAKMPPVFDVRSVRVGDQEIFLSHYAHRVWNKSHYGTWHCYGHSHGTLPDDPNALSLDVGVDAWGFKPVSFEQIKERMSRKTFKPIDHHGSR
jgi:calcineurin-like phosphoesterase family protein